MPANRYERLLEHVFFAHYEAGAAEVVFYRDELVAAAERLGLALPKNLGDIVYSFRYRAELPAAVADTAPEGKSWIIRPAGPGRYRFVATSLTHVVPREGMARTKVPNATPGVIEMYALTDEQALLAKLRYNRLIDIFTGLTCYSLQSHLRTTVKGLGQVETDELYVGVDRRGVHTILPVQAKGGRDRLNVVQIEQDLALCAAKYGSLPCRPIAAQFVESSRIAMFEFEMAEELVSLVRERHYQLVPPEELSAEDLQRYMKRSEEA